MKKAFAVALAVLTALCLTTAFAEVPQNAPDAEAFDAMLSANTGEAILSRHASFQDTSSTLHDAEEVDSLSQYIDADTYLLRFSDGFATLIQPELWVEWYPKYQAYSADLFDTAENALSSFESVCSNAIFDTPEEERLVETALTDEGLFVAVTEISDPEYVESLMELYAVEGGYEYAEGMTLRIQYTFDAQSTDLLSIETDIIDAEGAACAYQVTRLEYDVPDYDPTAEGEPFAAFLAARQDPEQCRTISLVFAPDTEDEHSIDYVLPHHCYYNVFIGDEFAEHIYTDRECTQAFEGSNGMDDLLLYVK